MSNPFEALSATAFSVASTTFGHDASWAPSGGGATISARVCFQKAANLTRVDLVGPAPIEPVFEYLPADIPGLFEAVRAGDEETVTVDGTAYIVAAVDPIDDGTIYLARLAVV